MRTVVVVSPAEVVRIVALAVMARPENAGRVCPLAMPGAGADGVPLDVPELHVVACDTQEEAEHVSRELASVGTAQRPTAPVLQLVTPAAAERIRCGDYARLKSGGPAMHVVMEDCTSGPSRGELHCVWPGENGEMSHGSFKPEMLELAPLRAFDERCDAS